MTGADHPAGGPTPDGRTPRSSLDSGPSSGGAGGRSGRPIGLGRSGAADGTGAVWAGLRPAEALVAAGTVAGVPGMVPARQQSLALVPELILDELARARRGVIVLAVDGLPLRTARDCWAAATVRCLTSVFPTVSAPAWLTALTGAEPAEHGVPGMVYRLPGRPVRVLAVTGRPLADPRWGKTSQPSTAAGPQPAGGPAVANLPPRDGPRAAGGPDTAGGPETGGAPETAGSPESPGAPETASRPETASSPETAGGPETGSRPETAGRPETPGEPETGSRPETASSPDTAGGPETGGGPEAASSPETPGEPETGSRPETASGPEIPGRPEAGTLAAAPPTVFERARERGVRPVAIGRELDELPGPWTGALLRGAGQPLARPGAGERFRAEAADPAALVRAVAADIDQVLAGCPPGEPVLLWCYLNIDDYLHQRGPDAATEDALGWLDGVAAGWASRGWTVLAHSDHGQRPCVRDPDLARAWAELDTPRLCELPAGGAGRVRWLHPLPGRADELAGRLAAALGDAALVLRRDDLDRLGLLRLSPPLRARLGEVVAVAATDRFPVPDPSLRWEHGSTHPDEMLVPLAAWRP